ncbi:TPA: hypothetical protein HA235_02115 [Candidatus Woesearchaeota archaeon]|nr:hypothetical protein [Candidatus Woesearchaeota archaeon]HIJ13867.1 hypothetical protein [Candidatus Woesearchaeota archaeon]
MKWVFGLFIVLTILLAGCSSKKPVANYDALAQCLTEKGATMYGTEWCSHCKAQKELFGKSFQYINYVDCDKARNDCIAAGVDGYPTWKINNRLYPGTQSLYTLALTSDCLDVFNVAQNALTGSVITSQ